MLTKRIIPILLCKDGFLVRSQSFNFYQVIGNPYILLERYNAWNLDELIYLDISQHPSEQSLIILNEIAKQCFMPLTFGGGIQSLKDIEKRLTLGADKIALNSQALISPDFITQAAYEFGQQAIIVSIDVIKKTDGSYQVYSSKCKPIPIPCPFAWAKEVEARGAGEIIIQLINRDGTGNGFDLPLIKEIVDITQIPIIASSGASSSKDLQAVLSETNASAAAAASLFMFTELSYSNIKSELFKKKANIRYSLESITTRM